MQFRLGRAHLIVVVVCVERVWLKIKAGMAHTRLVTTFICAQALKREMRNPLPCLGIAGMGKAACKPHSMDE